MEHPCAKCSATVEDGMAFCPHCRAPQIRVVTVETSTGETTPPRFSQATPGMISSLRLPQPPILWNQALPAAAVGGAVGFLSMFVPFGALGPAYLLGGALAVLIYRWRAHILPAPGGGAKIGAASGAFGSLIIAIIFVGAYVYNPEELRKVFMQAVTQLSARGYDAQHIQQATDMLNSSSGLASFTVFLLVTFFIIFVAGASIGGALCVAYLRRRLQ
jgi:hypothetical protein